MNLEHVRYPLSRAAVNKTLTVSLTGLCAFLLATVGYSQSVPKLGIAKLEASPNLSKASQAQVASKINLSSQMAEVLVGNWNGNIRRTNTVEIPTRHVDRTTGTTNTILRQSPRTSYSSCTLIIGKAQNGLLSAEFKEGSARNILISTSVTYEENHVKITFPNSTNGTQRILEADVSPLSKQMVATLITDNTPVEVTLSQSSSSMRSEYANRAARAAQTQSVVQPLTVGDLGNAIDLRLVDSFRSVGLFSIVEDSNLKEVAPLLDCKEVVRATAAGTNSVLQLQQAGIKYLLFATLEEFQEQSVDLAQDRSSYQTAAGQVQSASRNSPSARSYSGTVSSTVRQGDLAARVSKQQFVYFTVRLRLLDTTSGEIVESINKSFSTNRVYTVLAQGDNSLATTYLLEGLAKSVSEWAMGIAIEAAFPLKILEKNERIVTINRGADIGIKPGRTYDVVIPGKAIKDPSTGELLGHDEVVVGRVAITSLQQKFSKASLLSEDKGIVPGAILRRVQSR